MPVEPRAIAIPLHRKVLYLAVLLIALVAACEGALRVRAWIRYGGASASVRDPMLVYDATADLYVPRAGYELRGDQINIKINSLGFRGDEFTRDKPPNTIRIVCLGASTTFNAEVSSNHATWPHRLQEKLQAAYPQVRIEVLNAAVGGYVAADSLKNLRHRVLALDPDLVIYYEANNEIVRDTGELAMERGLIDRAERPGWVTTLGRYSLLFDLGYKNLAILARSRGAGGPKIDSVPDELPNRFIATLDAMRSELAARDIPLLLSTFIVKYRRDQDRATQIANADVAFYYMPWMSIDGMLDAMDKYNGAILRYTRSNGLLVVDDRTAIPADANHFTDCMHLNDKGAEAMAERFYRFLRRDEYMDEFMIRNAEL
jgi:lysophospholipase L1-like esterase